jgi:hypothetical protein
MLENQAEVDNPEMSIPEEAEASKTEADMTKTMKFMTTTEIITKIMTNAEIEGGKTASTISATIVLTQPIKTTK